MSHIQNAARAVERIMSPIKESYAESYAYDSLFDGGEWSGPAICDAEQEAERRVIEQVADRFKVEVSALEQVICESQNEPRFF